MSKVTKKATATEKSIEKPTPRNLEAEQAVLGSIMLDMTGCDDDRVWDVCQMSKVTPDSFTDPRNQVLYSVMQDLSRESKPLDYVTLLEKLRTSKQLETVGGAAYLQSLYDNTPTTAHAEYYINIVKDKQRRRLAIQQCLKTLEQCYDEHDYPDTQSVLSKAEEGFLSIDMGNDVAPTFESLLENAKCRALELANATGRKLKGLSTGFKKLDETMQGLVKGKMIVIGARPSIGKTSLAMNIAENVAMEGHEVLVFSLEMSPDDLTDRMISSGSGVNLDSLRTLEIRLPKERMVAYEKFAAQADNLKKAKLEIRSVPNADISAILPIARRDKKRRNTELIILDYLQLCGCQSVSSQHSRQLEVAEISRQLKGLARQLDVPVIVLSQLSREGVKDGTMPALHHLRDSGAIEQDADVVLLLRRPFKDKTGTASEQADEKLAYVNVAKNRDGETGEVAVTFESAYTRFSDK